MNAALLQVYLHWVTLKHPLAYFWHTLMHEVWEYTRQRAYDQQWLVAYGGQHWLCTYDAERITQQVADVLERIPPCQQQLLKWQIQGYNDTQIATWLQTTPQAIRVKRHRLIHTLRAQLYPSGGHSHYRRQGEK
jgi:hypothetical protein